MKGWAKTLGAAAAALFLGSPAASGGSGLGDLEARLTAGPALADLLAYAYRASPMVAAAREGWRASAERVRVQAGWPDPELMMERKSVAEPMWEARLTQMVPFPGKLGAMGAVAEREARVAELALDREVRDLTVRVRESVHELLYLRDAKRVVAQNRELLEHLRKVAETAYAADRAQLVDVMKAQSQSAQLQYDAILLEELDRVERARLNALLNRPPRAPLGPLAEEPTRALAYGLEEVEALAQAHQEELRMADAEIEAGGAMARVARLERLPDFTVGLMKDPIDGGRDSYGFLVGMTLPLWPGKNSGRVAEAEARVGQARAMKAARVNETLAEVSDAWFRLENSRRLVTLYRDELLPQAARSLEIAETWYRQGQGSFSDFVETQAAHSNFQLALARARADAGKQLARLEGLVGRSLTSREGER